MTEILKTDAILSAFRTLADGTLRTTFDLNEITPKTGSSIMALRGQFGCLVFAISGSVFETPKPKTENGKTPSQRLRATIFRYQEHLGNQEDSEAFYIKTMENIISQFKEKMG